MSVEFTWTVLRMERRAADGYVITANWALNGKDGEFEESLHNQTYFDTVDNFIPYEELSETQVIEWIRSTVNEEDLKSIIEQRIASKKNPVTLVGIPWATKV